MDQDDSGNQDAYMFPLCPPRHQHDLGDSGNPGWIPFVYYSTGGGRPTPPGGARPRQTQTWSLSTELGWMGSSSDDEEEVVRTSTLGGEIIRPPARPTQGLAQGRHERVQAAAREEETPIPTITHEELILARRDDERTFRIIIIFGAVLWFVIFGDLF